MERSRFLSQFFFSLAFLLPLTSPPAMANTEPAACVDTDGDGWGWDGTQSCRITTTCVDTDGDGWGWDGTQSCRIGTPVATACIDTDGDGWGWDGTQSCRIGTPVATACIDTDGDGWGWDGTQSCRIDSNDGYTQEDKEAFIDSLVAYRVSECFDLAPDSYRLVDAWTPEHNMEDYHYFRGNTTCEGLPLGLTFPLQVYSYTIGDRITTENGTEAWEIDYSSIQRGGDEYGFLGDDYGVEADGTIIYGIVGTDSNDEVLYGEGELIGTPPRETSLEAETFYQTIPPYGDSSLSVDTLVASTWHSDCVFRSEGSSGSDSRTFTADSATFTRTVWDSEDCTGDVDYRYRIVSDIEFDDALSMTQFGGYILNFRDETVEAVFEEGVPPDSIRDEVEGFVGRVKYQGLGLVGDTIISGDCLIREGCESSPETASDILDLGFLYRWTRG